MVGFVSNPTAGSDAAVLPFVPVIAWMFHEDSDSVYPIRDTLLGRHASESSLATLLRAVDYARRHGGPTVAWSDWSPTFAALSVEPWNDAWLFRTALLASCATAL